MENTSIVDNALVSFKEIHHIKLKLKGKVGEVSLKVNMSKVYDRIEWGFLGVMLLKICFCDRWMDFMMMCLDSMKYRG